MSRLTRNRKRRLAERKQKEENSKKFDKAMENYIKTIKIIERDYPGYENMSGENAVKLFAEILETVKNG